MIDLWDPAAWLSDWLTYALCTSIQLFHGYAGNSQTIVPEVVEKIWETVAIKQWFDCSPSILKITVLLPNCFKSPKYCQQYADARRWRRDIWRVMTSFVTWPVNSELFTGK